MKRLPNAKFADSYGNGLAFGGQFWTATSISYPSATPQPVTNEHVEQSLPLAETKIKSSWVTGR